MRTMVRKGIYSPFQIYILYMNKINSERDLILAGAIIKGVCILNSGIKIVFHIIITEYD